MLPGPPDHPGPAAGGCGASAGLCCRCVAGTAQRGAPAAPGTAGLGGVPQGAKTVKALGQSTATLPGIVSGAVDPFLLLLSAPGSTALTLRP